MFAHINVVREDVIFLGVNNWEGVYRDEYLIALTVYSYRVVEVLVLIVRSELNINVLCNSRGNHALLVILYLKVWC